MEIQSAAKLVISKQEAFRLGVDGVAGVLPVDALLHRAHGVRDLDVGVEVLSADAGRHVRAELVAADLAVACSGWEAGSLSSSPAARARRKRLMSSKHGHRDVTYGDRDRGVL